MFLFPLVALALCVPVPPEGLVGRVGSAAFRAPVDCQLVGVSADGKRVYCATYSFSPTTRPVVLVWDAATGRLVTSHPVGEPEDHVFEVAMRDGQLRLPVVRGGTRTVRTVDPDTGRTLSSTPLTRDPPETGDGRFSHFIAERYGAHGWTSRIESLAYRLRSAVTGSVVELPIDPNTHPEIRFREDGRMVVFVPHGKPARVYDLPSGRMILELPTPEGEQSAAAFTPDGKSLSVWTKRKGTWTLDLWDVAAKSKRTLLESQHVPGGLGFAPDGKTFARLPSRIGAYHPGGDWEVRSVADGRVLSRMPSESYSSRAAFGPDGKTLYLQSGSRTVVPWDTATGKPLAVSPDPPGEISRFRFTADGKIVALVAAGVSTFDRDGGKELSRVRLPRTPDHFYGLRFNAAGDRVSFVDFDRRLTTWDHRTGKETGHVIPAPPPNSAPDEKFTPDGAFQIGGGQNLLVRSVVTGTTRTDEWSEEWRPLGGITLQPGELAASADGRRIAVASSPVYHSRPTPTTALSVFDPTGVGRPRSAVVHDFGFTSLVFSPDGRWLACGVAGPTDAIRVYDAATLRVVATVPNFGANPNGLTFSPDGRLLAASCAFHEVRVFETASWRERAVLPSPARVYPYGWSSDRHRDLIAFSPDGRRLATATPDGGLIVWDPRKLAPTPTRPASFEAAWADLLSDDARQAHAAVRVLAEFPDVSLPFLRAKLPPVVGPDPKAIAAAVARLDSDDFAEREAATRTLAGWGRHAEGALRVAQASHDSLEVRRRAGVLLGRLPIEKPTPEDRRAIRVVEAVEWADTPAGRELLRAWAGGAPGARLTRDAAAALARAAR